MSCAQGTVVLVPSAGLAPDGGLLSCPLLTSPCSTGWGGEATPGAVVQAIAGAQRILPQPCRKDSGGNKKVELTAGGGLLSGNFIAKMEISGAFRDYVAMMVYYGM